MNKGHYEIYAVDNIKVKYDQLLNYLKYNYCISYQEYSETYYGLTCNYYYVITSDIWRFMYRFYFRFYQGHVAICQYLKIYGPGKNRLKRATMDVLGIPHNNTKLLITNMSRHKCPICQQEQYASHYFKHIVTIHKMSKHDCLLKYFNIPDDTDTEDFSFPMLLDMREELQKSQCLNYKDLYIDIIQKCPNAIELKQNYNYDIIRVLKALNISIKAQSTLAWQYNNSSNLYVGYRKDLKMSFRSTWEANIARILNNSNISFTYESKKFILPYNNDTLVYILDFYLPGSDTYIEVKGFWCNQKAHLFREQYPNKFLLIIDQFIYKRL